MTPSAKRSVSRILAEKRSFVMASRCPLGENAIAPGQVSEFSRSRVVSFSQLPIFQTCCGSNYIDATSSRPSGLTAIVALPVLAASLLTCFRSATS